MRNNKKSKFFSNRGLIAKILLVLYDVFFANLSYLLALWLRFDCEIQTLINKAPEFIKVWVYFVPINTVITLIVFSFFKLYRSVWTFASYREFFNVLYATISSCVLHVAGITIIAQLSRAILCSIPVATIGASVLIRGTA